MNKKYDKGAIRKKLEHIYKQAEEAAERIGTEELAILIGEEHVRDAINGTFFDAVMLECKRDPMFRENLTQTILLAALTLKM